MPTYAPPYHPSKPQRSFFARQQETQTRKRKRDHDSGDDDSKPETPPPGSASPEPTPRTAPSAFHPVNKTDPFYVAGHPRERALPPPPFPHSAIKDPPPPKRPIEEDLATLNPPLRLPPKLQEDRSTSLKRRHLDNITAILHRSLLAADWKRAYRAWALLLRTEIRGRGVDVRRHGRWGIGAELLMRGPGHRNLQSEDGRRDSSADDYGDEDQGFTDEGFTLARAYYERLILQYPHTQYTQHHFNATAVYPALFNIWVYSAQDRAKRAREALEAQTSDLSSSSDDDDDGTDSSRNRPLRSIILVELDAATAIVARMDELVMSPPYDTDTNLLRLRGMVALWVADLHGQASMSKAKDSSEVSDASAGNVSGSITPDDHRSRARAERQRAHELFSRLAGQGEELPASIRAFLENWDDEP